MSLLSFLAPLFLIGLGAIVVPILVHLIQRERKRVIEFPSLEQAVACFESPEYRDAAAYRRRNGVGEVENVIVEGLDTTHR